MSITVIFSDALRLSHPADECCVLDDTTALALHNAVGLPLVKAIFPWGTDAVFNRLQTTTLVAEIERVLNDASDVEVRENLQRLLAFLLPRVDAEVDGYAVFLAD